MVKVVFREILIILLLCAAILLLLGVVLYDYNPTNKVIPNKVAYTIPDNVKSELEESSTKQNVLKIEPKVYTIEGTDLNVYKKSKIYNPSKQNPFVSSTEGSGVASASSAATGTTNTNNKVNGNTQGESKSKEAGTATENSSGGNQLESVSSSTGIK